MNYHQLTQEQCQQIYNYKKIRKSPIEIANLLGRDKSTIYRELFRKTAANGYPPKQVGEMAVKRHQDT